MATYTPPGVFVKDTSDAVYSASAVSPSSIGIFGEAAQTSFFVEDVLIPPDTIDSEGLADPVQEISNLLTHPNASNIVVVRKDNEAPLTEDVDYEIVTSEANGANWYALRRLADSELLADEGEELVVSYNYSPLNFFETLRFTSAHDVIAFYGPAFDETGQLNSPLTLAAQLAFDNGALSVITRATAGSGENDYLAALTEINKAKDIAILTCTSGDAALIPSISQAINAASKTELERRAILGFDGVHANITTDAQIAVAGQVANPRVALVTPPIAMYRIRDLATSVEIGGQFIAAAVAGVAISLGFSEPLTRKAVFGFEAIPDLYDTSTKNALASAGLMVVEETLQGIVRIRHGVTTSTASKNTSEWSVVGVTDYVVSSVRTMLDNAGFIGSAITPATVPSLIGMVTSFLTNAVIDDVIGDYSDLSVQQRATEPDIIDIRFSVGFMFPLNRIYVTMSSSASQGSTAVTVV